VTELPVVASVLDGINAIVVELIVVGIIDVNSGSDDGVSVLVTKLTVSVLLLLVDSFSSVVCTLEGAVCEKGFVLVSPAVCVDKSLVIMTDELVAAKPVDTCSEVCCPVVTPMLDGDNNSAVGVKVAV
jgi:hypothetical protein